MVVLVQREAHFRSGRLVDMQVNGKKLRIPVIIAFGMAENTVVIPMGYGQGYDENWVDEFVIPTAMFSDNYGATCLIACLHGMMCGPSGRYFERWFLLSVSTADLMLSSIARAGDFVKRIRRSTRLRVATKSR